MIGKLIDAALEAPGKITEATVEIATRLPAVPVDMVNKAWDGMERGIDKVTDPERKKP